MPACIAIGAMALGAGAGAIASSSNGGIYQGTPGTPDPLAADTAQLQAQIDLAPQQFAAEQQFDPQYAGLYQNIISQSLLGGNGSPGLLNTYSQAAPQEQQIQNQLNTQQLQGNLNNLQSMGGSAVQAFTQANPQLAQIQNAMVNQATGPAPVNQYNAPNSPLASLGSWGGGGGQMGGQFGGGQMGQQPGQGASWIGGQQQPAGQPLAAQAVSPQGAAQYNPWGGLPSGVQAPGMTSQAPNTAGMMGSGAEMGTSEAGNIMGGQMGQMGGGSQGANAYNAAYSNPQLQQLNQSTMSQLALGGQLPSQTTADISNQTLSAMNTAGRATDPAAAANLALNLNSTQQQMLQQRQAAAGSVAGLNTSQGATNQQAYLGQQGLTLQGATAGGQMQMQQNYYNQLAQGQNYGLQGSALSGANSAIMGTTMPALGTVLSPSTAFSGTGALYNQASGLGTGSQNFNPFQAGTALYADQYQDINGPKGSGQFNAGTNQGILSAGMSMFGSGMSGLAMACWAAREAYGWSNPKWLKAREWMLTKAPAEIRDLYLKCGQLLAWEISQDSDLKDTVRAWFDLKLQQEAA